MRGVWTTRAVAAGAVACLAGCHGPFLGEDFQAEALPLRQVNAWPLLEREEDPETGESRSLALGGFVYHHDEPHNDAAQAAAFPFYWHARQGQETRTRVPPLYWHTADAEGATTALLPLFYAREEGERSTLVALPGLYRARDGEETRLNLLAFLADWRTRPQASQGSLVGIGPLALAHWSREGERSWAHAFPLWFSSHDELGGADVVFPFYWRFSDGSGASRTLLFPLLHHAEDGQGGGQTDVLWPLYHRRVEGPARHDWSVLGYMVTYERTDPQASDLRVLYKLFRRRQDGSRRETSLAPLFTVSRDDEADYRSFSLLGPLYRYERKGAARTHRLLHFIRWGSDAAP